MTNAEKIAEAAREYAGGVQLGMTDTQHDRFCGFIAGAEFGIKLSNERCEKLLHERDQFAADIARIQISDLGKLNYRIQELERKLAVAVEALTKISLGWECSACSCCCHVSAIRALEEIEK